MNDSLPTDIFLRRLQAAIEEARWERAPWIEEDEARWEVTANNNSSQDNSSSTEDDDQDTSSLEYTSSSETQDLSTLTSSTIPSQKSGKIVEQDWAHQSLEAMEIDLSGFLLVLDEPKSDVQNVPMDTLIPEDNDMTVARLEQCPVAFLHCQPDISDACNINMGE